MKFLNFDKVLCLSPHPDDVEYSMSGTILKYQDTHFDILCLSTGMFTDRNFGEIRLKEYNEFWEKFGNNVSLYFSHIDDFSDLKEYEWVSLIEQAIVGKKYDAIIGTTGLDSHFEHRFVNGLMPALIRFQPISILEYKSPSTLDEWTPNLFVDIKSFSTKKISMLRKYFRTQNQKSYFSEDAIKVFHSHYNCNKRGIFEVEQFKIKNLFE